jgi:hypothetical protein
MTMADLTPAAALARRQAEYRAAQEEAEIRVELTERVRDAIRAESERIGQEVGWSGDLDEAFAIAAVDALDQYVREGRTR